MNIHLLFDGHNSVIHAYLTCIPCTGRSMKPDPVMPRHYRLNSDCFLSRNAFINNYRI